MVGDAAVFGDVFDAIEELLKLLEVIRPNGLGVDLESCGRGFKIFK